MSVLLLGSLTRIADFDFEPWEMEELPREEWALGDYVIGETVSRPSPLMIELASGRMVQALPGDLVVGAFGDRAATLEGVGSFRDIEGRRMHAMTGAGLFGRATSWSTMVPPPVEFDYRGHIVRDGAKVTMSDFVVPSDGESFDVPTVLLVGTSMSAGKTTAGRMIVHELQSTGKAVIGAKLTGAGRYRDVLSFQDAGAERVFDFVDAGLPSTVLPAVDYLAAIRPLLARIDRLRPDVLVAEAGASPLEPYNGAAAIAALGDNITHTVVCASDPYAVLGVEHAFGIKPTFVAGPATSTSAAIELVQHMCGVPAINVLDPASRDELRRMFE